MDVGALAAAGVAALVGVTTWTQSRQSNRRSDFVTITDQLRKDLLEERQQRKLLTTYVITMMAWAEKVESTSLAGPPPAPPPDLDITPFRR